MAVPTKRDAASDDEEDFHSGRDSGDDKSVFSDSDDDANVMLQPPGATPAAGEHAKSQQRGNEYCKSSIWPRGSDPSAPSG